MKQNFYLVCDNIRSLENIGSIFRTADALAISKIFLCGICGKPPHPKISKTALGAEETVPWEYFRYTGLLIKRLKKEGIRVVGLEQTKRAILYTKFKPSFPLALIIGNEVEGISPRLLKKCDDIIFLPMLGRKESLNVTVAFGVAGYYLNQFRK